MDSAPDAVALQAKLRSQLSDRRSRLESTIASLDQPADLVRLLAEVDSALSRLDAGNYGACLVCHESVEVSDLRANPMATYCLCPLTPERQRALEGASGALRRLAAQHDQREDRATERDRVADEPVRSQPQEHERDHDSPQ